jgi:hypothetical protein
MEVAAGVSTRSRDNFSFQGLRLCCTGLNVLVDEASQVMKTYAPVYQATKKFSQPAIPPQICSLTGYHRCRRAGPSLLHPSDKESQSVD